ncbi:AbrB/MazE/SpoVT family DNA-binding domain-containing protein [Metarhizobium album]|uniref:AbrB/MazE/SpoVT family DNA-binding domain-containing protein n=1 Tax=Metarhizobium album TaxID=2182425 RepID=A0A2U2DY87_9HYPH|nr:AbrB/MazE/SpoVT family DNA-binding domain-containing protein [Rhizobium album]PWE58281.1 AbrB/MazE/SpoVT family DNA-binding domain-containing protein [Rhizobium album]
MGAERHVKLFRHGQHHVVLIPVEFELPGEDAIMSKESDRLVIQPTKASNLLEWLMTIEPWDEEFPDIDEKDPLPREFDL